jgi:hypothetical protein
MAPSPIPAQKPNVMSIWINKSIYIIALVGLTACQSLDLVPPQRSISVLDGTVTIAAHNGYCVDTNVSMTGADNAVVLMGRCSASSNFAPALLTASLGAKGSGAALSHGPVALVSFFKSPAGLTLLSAKSNAQDVQIKDSKVEGEMLFLRISDNEIGDYWRAISSITGRLLMLSASGASGLDLAPDDGRALLSKTLLVLQKANPMPPVPKAE